MKGNKWQQQKFMRARVVAQGLTFTVVFLSMAAQERADKRQAQKNASTTQSPPTVAGTQPSRVWQHVAKGTDFPWELYTCSEFWLWPCFGPPQEPPTGFEGAPLPYTV